MFRYPINIKDTFVKRVMGVGGDHIKLVNKKVYLNGHMLNEPYVVHKTEYIDSYRDNFPGDPNVPLYPPAQAMLQNNVVDGEVVVPNGFLFRHGRQSRFVTRQPLLGLCAAGEYYRQAADHLLVV